MTRACGRNFYCVGLCDAVRTLLSLPQERQDRDIAPAAGRDLRRGAFALHAQASL
jgi:hypothetical protein